MLSWFKKKAPEERAAAFWAWFVANQKRLRAAPAEELAQQPELASRIEKAAPGLAFQLSAGHDGPREFVLSADGIRERIPAVLTLVEAAPKLDDWRVIAFRQRDTDPTSIAIRFNGLDVSGNDIVCSVRRLDERVDVDMFIPGCPAEADRAFMGAGFLMVDAALGEFDAMTKMGTFRVMSPEAPAPKVAAFLSAEATAKLNERFPFSELRQRFDALLESRTTR